MIFQKNNLNLSPTQLLVGLNKNIQIKIKIVVNKKNK